MIEKINTQEIERKAYLIYCEDGIFDIYFGLVIFIIAIQFLYEQTSLLWILVLFPFLYYDTKRRHTFPRLRYIMFNKGPGRAKKSKLLLYGLLSLTVLISVVVWFSASNESYELINIIRPYSSWLFASLSLGIFSIFSYVSGQKRLYYYGAVSFAIFVLLNTKIYCTVNWGCGDPLATLGGIISLNGYIMLLNFKREYPLEDCGEI